MEIVGVLVFIVLLMTLAGTVSAVLRGGSSNISPDRSEPWTSRELPNNSCWTARVF
ncbi:MULTISPECIES: hypothetical protein [Arthrobacter]|uniref:hypothetical protein n=1 Tax=Arthrobacter TaxID=1663 RepID=UPI001404D5A3|nr:MULTISPECIES: hypothetical protein [Arthrobacter]MBT8161090.1 hypothetical protein [Arthrobacter sp. GN70]